jgi:glutamyl-Q tRNA(Asp) synthetase
MRLSAKRYNETRIILVPETVCRFAPSPNGFLHLGHAYSALLNEKFARDTGGRFLLRIEDIDPVRCKPEFERAIFEDLKWLGLKWETPVRRQAAHLEDYRTALTKLREMELVYPAFLSRSQIKTLIMEQDSSGTAWPRDPDGSAIYPGLERDEPWPKLEQMISQGRPYAWRLNVAKAMSVAGMPTDWTEVNTGTPQTVLANPAAWGDVILARMDTPTSYHLSVVLDDAAQGITHVIRGMDLYHATSIHRLLQILLGLPELIYNHHELIMGNEGRKLAKSNNDPSLRDLRQSGVGSAEIRKMLGF